MTEAYGQRLGEALRVENAPAIVSRALCTADIAVTEIRCDNPLPEMSGSIQQEDAFLVALQLRDFPTHKYWEDGRQAPVCDLRAGESCLYDLKRDPTVLLDQPYHSLHFYLPRAALDAIADDANAPRIRDLSYEPGAGVNDATISGLGSLLLPALSHPDQANPLFVDHVLLAVGVHIAQTYGGMRPMSRPARGGLAPWQARRAREILRGNVKRGVALKEVARECGLSVGHFSHAFRRTLGVAPHKWLIEQRVVLSKEKLRDEGLSLSDVATECGFSDQSHLTRVFRHNGRRKSGRVASSPQAIASEHRNYQDRSKTGRRLVKGHPTGGATLRAGASRYDRLAANYLVFVKLASVRIMSPRPKRA